MKLCNTCGQPVTRGHSGSDTTAAARCLVCRTAEVMRGFPTKQRELRDAAQTRRQQRVEAGQMELFNDHSS